jgi:hypothetical protein
LNYRTYTPDKSAEFNDKKLGEVASINEINIDFNNDKDIKNIDVMWCDDENFPILCFEVENTTDFLKALTRFHKLRRLQTTFFFVAPNEKREEFEKIIKALPHGIKRERCRFVAYSDLEALFDNIFFCEKITQVLNQKLTLEI